MEIAKALVLAGRDPVPGGRPLPSVGPGSLVCVANRPILHHHLAALRRAGVIEATISAHPAEADAIHAAVGDGAPWDIVVRYAASDGAPGIGSALSAARDFVGDEPILVQRAGALLLERMHGHISAFASERLDALALRVGAAGLDAGWLLSPRAVDMLAGDGAVPEDPIAHVRDRGGHVRVQGVDGCLPCHGGQHALLEANRRMLEGLVPEFEEGSLHASELQGPVVVHPSAHLERTLVRGPAIIGPRARLVESYVGPYSSIGSDVSLEGVEIEHSIVLQAAVLSFLGVRIESSIIGPSTRVTRGFGPQHAVRLSLGEGAEVVLS